MESIYTELALNGSKDECARTDIVFSTISEVCDGTVSLIKLCKQHLLINFFLYLLISFDIRSLLIHVANLYEIPAAENIIYCLCLWALFIDISSMNSYESSFQTKTATKPPFLL